MGSVIGALDRAWRWFFGRGLPATQMPPWIFFVQLAWLLLLFGAFFAYIQSPDVRHDLPHAFGKIPVEAPWLGALGGCLASFTGIFFHNRDSWEAKFNYWHPVKPLIGAATGAVGCVLLLVTLRAATGTSKLPTDPTTFDAAAFVFGYAEGAFRHLIATVTNALIKPGSNGPSAPGAAGKPVPPAPAPASGPSATQAAAPAPSADDPS